MISAAEAKSSLEQAVTLRDHWLSALVPERRPTHPDAVSVAVTQLGTHLTTGYGHFVAFPDHAAFATQLADSARNAYQIGAKIGEMSNHSEQTNGGNWLELLQQAGDHAASGVALLNESAVAVPKTAELATWTPSSSLPAALKTYGTDVTEQAAASELTGAIGRRAEIKQVIGILDDQVKNNPVLLGDPGVGKTAIIEELAKRIVSGEVPASLQNRRLVLIDLNAMVAGTTNRGMFEERLKNVVDAIVASDGQFIPVVDEIHRLPKAGSAESTHGAGMTLLEPLGRGRLRMIGASTPDQYKEEIEADGAFSRRLTPVAVSEPSPSATLDILRGLAPKIEGVRGVAFTDAALRQIVTRTNRYLPESMQPDNAVTMANGLAGVLGRARTELPADIEERSDQLDHLRAELSVVERETDPASLAVATDLKTRIGALDAQVTADTSSWHDAVAIAGGESVDGADEVALRERFPDVFRTRISPDDVDAAISKQSGVPVGRLGESNAAMLDQLPERLGNRVFGQPEAVSAVAAGVRRARAGLTDPNRAAASILELGPPGVGKTELAKALAAETGKRLLRVDLSNPTVTRNGWLAKLTDQIRRSPHSVVLLDEIEGATSADLESLVTAFDEGYLASPTGRNVSTKDVDFILTSNMSEKDARAVLPPKIVDRLGSIVSFHPLGTPELRRIVDQQMDSLRMRLPGHAITVTDAAADLIVNRSLRGDTSELGFHGATAQSEQGARLLKHRFESDVVDALVAPKLHDELQDGGRTTIDAEDGRLTFTTTPAPVTLAK